MCAVKRKKIKPPKRPIGRPKKPNAPPYVQLRIRPDSILAIKLVALALDTDWQDLLDDAIQVGASYIYQRNRMNKAEPIVEVPEIWERLPVPAKIKTLRGTEFPSL